MNATCYHRTEVSVILLAEEAKFNTLFIPALSDVIKKTTLNSYSFHSSAELMQVFLFHSILFITILFQMTGSTVHNNVVTAYAMELLLSI